MAFNRSQNLNSTQRIYFKIYTSSDQVGNLVREHTVNLDPSANAMVFPDHYKLICKTIH